MFTKKELCCNTVGSDKTVDLYTTVCLDLKRFATKYPDYYGILKKIVADEEKYELNLETITDLDTLDQIRLEFNKNVNLEDILLTYGIPSTDDEFPPDEGCIWLCDRQYVEENEPNDTIKLYNLFKSIALSSVGPRPAIYASRHCCEDDCSLNLQVHRCADYIGVDEYDTYWEQSSGGYIANRPVLAKLMEDVKSGKINHVLVASSDRLSWSKDEIKEVESELLKNNARLTVVHDAQ